MRSGRPVVRDQEPNATPRPGLPPDRCRPARVLCASHTPALKGSAISLCELMKSMDRNRFFPVAAFSKPGPLVEDLERHGIKARVSTRKGALGLGTIREAMEIIDGEGIDIVHVNSAVPFSKYVGIAAWWRRLPLVWHIREDPHGKRVRRLGKWIRFLATRIIVITAQQEAVFRSTGKVTKIANGVDTDRFSPRADGGKFRKSCGIPLDAFLFGIVGTIEENKGTLNFMEAARLLAKSYPDAFFAVVGGGLPEDLRQLSDFVQTDPLLRTRTRITGPLAEMPQVLAGLDVLVVASRWESFPRVLIESMACGRPAIAPSVGEIPRIMDSEKTGFLIPENSVSALRLAMERCLLDREALAQMGMAAMEKARAEFSIERHARAVESVYEEASKRHEVRRLCTDTMTPNIPTVRKPRPIKKLKRAAAYALALPFLVYFRLRPRDFRQISQALSLFPFSFGRRVRQEFYRRALESCGDNVTFHFGTILGYPQIRLGNNVSLGEYNVLGLVEMDDDVLTAHRCSFLSGRHIHSFDDTVIPIRKQKTWRRTIYIGRDVWVGAHAVVMESVGEGSVIGAGSVVTKPVGPYHVVAGNPARVIGIRGVKTD